LIFSIRKPCYFCSASKLELSKRVIRAKMFIQKRINVSSASFLGFGLTLF